jgi:hypothetical protein
MRQTLHHTHNRLTPKPAWYTNLLTQNPKVIRLFAPLAQAYSATRLAKNTKSKRTAGGKVATLCSARARYTRAPRAVARDHLGDRHAEDRHVSQGVGILPDLGFYKPQGFSCIEENGGFFSPPTPRQCPPRPDRLPPCPPGPRNQTRREARVGGGSSSPSRGSRHRGGAVVPATRRPRPLSGRYAANPARGRPERGPPDVSHRCHQHPGQHTVGRGGGKALPNPLVGGTFIQGSEGNVPPGSGGDRKPVSRGVVDPDLGVGGVGEPTAPQRPPPKQTPA